MTPGLKRALFWAPLALALVAALAWLFRPAAVTVDLVTVDRGPLTVSVSDEGEIVGLETEFQSMKKPNVDGFENIFNMAFNKMVGVEFSDFVAVDFEVIQGKTVCRILALPASQPVYLNHNNKEEFYIRTGNSSQPLTISQAVSYVQRHFD